MKKLLVVLAVLALSTNVFAVEALENGGFDSGDLSPWTVLNDGTYMGEPGLMTGGGMWGPSTAPRDGSGLLGKSAAANMPGGNAGAYQTFATGASDLAPVAIDVSGYVAGGIGGNGNFNGAGWWEVRLIEGEFTNFDDGTLLWKNEITTDQGFDWTLAAGTVTTSSPNATLVLKYGGWDPEWDYMYYGAYFDTFSADVNPAPVPEPSSMLALGTGLFGLAGFAIRRRR